MENKKITLKAIIISLGMPINEVDKSEKIIV
jgi:hypothetical protein